MEETGKSILFYENKFYPFSNFSAFEVIWEGEVWKTVEHAYQAAKFKDEKIKKRIQNARSAHDAMKLAKIVYDDKKRKDWHDVKLSIMESIVRAKLSQHYYVQKQLILTDNRELIENSPRDSYWGWGPEKNGHNHLGKIWMKLREEFITDKIPVVKEDFN